MSLQALLTTMYTLSMAVAHYGHTHYGSCSLWPLLTVATLIPATLRVLWPLTYYAPPQVASLCPATGPRGGNTRVVISGPELKHGADPYCRFPITGGAPPGPFWGGGGGGGGGSVQVTAAWTHDQAAVVPASRVTDADGLAALVCLAPVSAAASAAALEVGLNEQDLRLQPPAHMVTAPLTYGDSLDYMWLQPPLHGLTGQPQWAGTVQTASITDGHSRGCMCSRTGQPQRAGLHH